MLLVLQTSSIMYMCISTHTHVYVYTCVYVHNNTYVCIYIYIYVYIYISCICMYIHTHIICTYIRIYIYIYVTRMRARVGREGRAACDQGYHRNSLSYISERLQGCDQVTSYIIDRLHHRSYVIQDATKDTSST